MQRIWTAVTVVALATTLASILWLAHLQAGGPERLELRLEGGVPATLYLPWAAGEPRPAGRARPPAVVLAHGIASDRRGVSSLARSLTQAGYAVLTFDFRGHGENRNPFALQGDGSASLLADMQAAVDFLRVRPEVDGGRISVMGHSMGAGVALDYAGIDPALDATVLISGGWRIEGPNRPANALFLYAAGDPPRIRERAAALAAELSGVEAAPPGQVFGSFAESTAVSQVQVARADHVTILSSSYAARQIIDWLDRSYGVERGTFFLRDDPRLRAAGIGLFAFLVLLPGIGATAGRLAPRLAERPREGAGRRLLALAAALLVTLPVVAVGGLAQTLPLAIGNTVVVQLFLSGSVLLVWLSMRGEPVGPSLRSAGPDSAFPAGVALVAVAFLLAPFAIVLHGLSLTPERLAVAFAVALLVLPFELVFHHLLRRGGSLASTAVCVLGRVLVLAVLVLAVRAGVLSGVVTLMLPVLALLFVLFELLAASVYVTSRSWLLAALVESGWLAWIFAAVLPITV